MPRDVADAPGHNKTHQPVKVWWVAMRRSGAERDPTQTPGSAGPAPERSGVALNSGMQEVARFSSRLSLSPARAYWCAVRWSSQRGPERGNPGQSSALPKLLTDVDTSVSIRTSLEWPWSLVTAHRIQPVCPGTANWRSRHAPGKGHPGPNCRARRWSRSRRRCNGTPIGCSSGPAADRGIDGPFGWPVMRRYRVGRRMRR